VTWSQLPFGGSRALAIYARRSLGMVTVVAVIFATLLGGQRYSYCRAMDEIMVQPKCECARSHQGEEGRASLDIDYDCFEARVLPRLVSFTVGAELAVPEAGLLAVLPAQHLEALPSNAIQVRADQPIRAGPFSPAAFRAQLMVFLT
jgi:hypothetical protein